MKMHNRLPERAHLSLHETIGFCQSHSRRLVYSFVDKAPEIPGSAGVSTAA